MQQKSWGAWLGALSVMVVLASGCAEQRDFAAKNGVSGEAAGNPVSAQAKGSAAPERSDVLAADSPHKLTAIADSEPDRYLIKNATLTLETADVRATTQRLITGARSRKGYVSDMHETVDALGSRTVTLQVRVPFSEFDPFVQQFAMLGKVLDKQVNAQDVTEEFVDTQSTLRNLKATEARLLAHLSRTGKLSDTLLVEKEINRVREEADRLEGRLRFLAHRVTFSTLNVTLRETAHPQAITPPESFSTRKVVADAARSLIGFGQVVWTLVIWLAMWSIVWLPPVIVVSVLRWQRRRYQGPPGIPPLPGSGHKNL